MIDIYQHIIFMKILTFITNHLIEIIGIGIAYFSLILPIIQFLKSKNSDDKEKRFKNFHQLIKELVQPDEKTNLTFIDRQVAVIFELKNLPDYYDVSLRILTGLKNDWHKPPDNPGNTRLIAEFDLTIDYITKYQNKRFRKLKRKICGT
jgi:hypothetical protein